MNEAHGAIRVTIERMKLQMEQFIGDHLGEKAISAAVDEAFREFDWHAAIRAEAIKRADELVAGIVRSVVNGLQYDQEFMQQVSSAATESAKRTILLRIGANQ